MVGNSYRVYLSFGAEGVSVSLFPNSVVCDYICVSEVIYIVTYTGHNVVCHFSSSSEPSTTLRNCIACQHLCAQRVTVGKNRTSVDACRLNDRSSTLYQLWSVLTVGGTLVLNQATLDLFANDSCLSFMSGYDLTVTPDAKCISDMSIRMPHRVVTIVRTDVVQCHVQAWSTYFDSTILAYGCTECLYDYIRLDANYVSYYGSAYQNQIQDVVRDCPGPVYLGVGGAYGNYYSSSTYDVNVASIQIAKAIEYLGAAGVQLEVTPNLLPLFSALHATFQERTPVLKLDALFHFYPLNGNIYTLSPVPNATDYDRQIFHHYNATSQRIIELEASYQNTANKKRLIWLKTEDEIVLTNTDYLSSRVGGGGYAI